MDENTLYIPPGIWTVAVSLGYLLRIEKQRKAPNFWGSIAIGEAQRSIKEFLAEHEAIMKGAGDEEG
jgi:hypothetical protein